MCTVFDYDVSLRLGIHTFTAGSLEKAALKAAELGANTFQIFSASPRMWRARVPDPVQVKLFKAARERFDLRPLAIHVNYLVNLASVDPVIRPKSIEAFRGELDRAAAIGAEYLVLHPGNYKGRSVEQGIAAFAQGLKEAAEGFRSPGLTVLLENTAGSGASLGSRLEELRFLRDLAGDLTELPIGYCLDTCHLLAAGFNVATAAGLRTTLSRIENTIGLDHVHLFHANDSKTQLGSRVDRHAHIGAGHIGLEGFRRILRHPKLRKKPFILETPIDQPEDDRRNLDALKLLATAATMEFCTSRLCRKSRTTTTKSN
ncbi:MAG TPA: deoxyribonuclease IV [Bryobacteraceae bacterium]|nr:deoxyribonuclease IV [Bryobacteraceae bacterium]